MKKAVLTLFALAFLFVLAVAPPAHAAGPVVVAAASRCNGQTIGDASMHIHDYDKHPPGNNPSQIDARYAQIADLLQVLREEREILQNVCDSDAQRAPYFADIAADAAYALVLEADLVSKMGITCPAAVKGLPTVMLADAWLALAQVVNDNNGAVPNAFANVVPKVQSRAAAIGLTLPAFAETSQYWHDQVESQAKQAMTACPSPPAPSPTPT